MWRTGIPIWCARDSPVANQEKSTQTTACTVRTARTTPSPPLEGVQAEALVKEHQAGSAILKAHAEKLEQFEKKLDAVKEAIDDIPVWERR
ncbi:hypothetical protein V501_01121 [Pseudogymnoascus sp. VKM F-4519 (FW-2642)]|nr:hypothetical protein V501_01121 [Pseudogymnoascus sp. VKM F-4519 (FW-2642)]